MQIELRNVEKRYGRGTPALGGVSLSVSPGERLAVLGPSGSGKTTLLRLIAGLESLDSGILRIDGRDMAGVPPHRRGVAMVFQTPALYPHLRVRDNLVFGLVARGVRRQDRRRRAAELAAMLGLEALMDRRPSALSGGERQRVALGRALAGNPAVLLLDEPFSFLDQPLRVELRAELLRLHGLLGSTLIHVTHDQEEALSLGQRVAVLRRGMVVQCDTPEEIHGRPVDRFVASFVGSPGMKFLDCNLFSNGAVRISLPVAGDAVGRGSPGVDDAATLPLDPSRLVLLGIRPEHVTVIPPGPVRPMDWRAPMLIVPARVLAQEFHGFSTLVTLSIGEGRIQARVSPTRELGPGDAVNACIDLLHARWFDPGTGMRVEPDCQALPDTIA